MAKAYGTITVRVKIKMSMWDIIKCKLMGFKHPVDDDKDAYGKYGNTIPAKGRDPDYDRDIERKIGADTAGNGPAYDRGMLWDIGNGKALNDLSRYCADYQNRIDAKNKGE